MPFQGPERRLRNRFRVQLPLTVKNSGQQTSGSTRNVSLLGISATVNGAFPSAQPVQCTLDLPQDFGAVTVHGTVVHCEPLADQTQGLYDIGVFFKEFEHTGESTLARYLEQISHKEESALKAGYQVLKQKVAARKRRKRIESLRKSRRKQQRLRKKQRRSKSSKKSR